MGGGELSTKGVGPLSRLPKDLRLYTIFSASNYSNGSNDAAVLHWRSVSQPPEIHTFRTSEPPTKGKVGMRNRVKITEILCRRHHRLLRAFETFDKAGKGHVT